MVAGAFRPRAHYLFRTVKRILFYVRLAVVFFSLLGIAFLLWTYADQNAAVSDMYATVTAQDEWEAPLTPADLVGITHSLCQLDSGIGNVGSFLQPMSVSIAKGGWCGNYVRIFIRLSKAQGHPAHKLHIQSGSRSHTLAEVYYEGKWRVVDPFFNLVYLVPGGEMATFDDLTENPSLAKTPTQRPLDSPRLEYIYQSYVPIFPALFSDAKDFRLGLSRSAFYHNAIVLLSYPLSPFYQGARRPIIPSWLDRPELELNA